MRKNGAEVGIVWRADLAAGAIFLPYLLWATFALVLNFAIWRLNP